jgi:hypothetical protein
MFTVLKKPLVIALAVILAFCVCPALAQEEAPENAFTFGSLPWFSSPEELPGYLAEGENGWCDVYDGIDGGNLNSGRITLKTDTGWSPYDGPGLMMLNGKYAPLFWEGRSEPVGEVTLGGFPVEYLVAAYVIEGDAKQLVSLSVYFEKEQADAGSLIEALKELYGEPSREMRGFAMWGDPLSESDPSTLTVRDTGADLMADFAITIDTGYLDSLFG